MRPSQFLIITFLFLSLLQGQGQNKPQAVASLESSMVVVGEETYLTLWTSGLSIIDWPDHPPKVAPLALKREDQRRFQVNGFIREGYRYRLIAFEPGVYQIPPFHFRTRQGVVSSKPLTLRAFSAKQLSTHGIKINGSVTPYLTGVFLENSSPYLGETQTVEAKIYLSQAPPNRLSLYDGKVIQFQKDGLAAWRFTTTRDPTGILDYDGQRFQVYTYRSSVSALREGKLTLGPGEADAILAYRLRGYGHKIQFPPAELEVRPLPSGAPSGFEGAVGNFEMAVRPLTNEITLGEAITTELAISGLGNLTRFPGPVFTGLDTNWKEFEMIAKPVGEERRSGAGTVEFSQLVRPLNQVSALPSYRFVFFDPVTGQYRTLESPTIPITVRGDPSTSKGPEALAFLTPGGDAVKLFHPKSQSPIWWWQAIPAALALVLVGGGLRRHLIRRKMSQQPGLELEREIIKVGEKADDRIAFYREAARVATEWRGGQDFEQIYTTRDEICFQLKAKPEPVDPTEKKQILKLLKTLTPLLLAALFLTFLPTTARALSSDPAAAKEEILIAMEKEPAPEHFYNLAVCEKKLGNEGEAALWSYRFQLQGGEAGPLLDLLPGTRAKKREWFDWITIFPKAIYRQVIFAGLWSLALLLLTLAGHRGRFRKGLIIFFAITTPLTLGAGSASWFWYPDEISFEPLENLSVVTAEVAMLAQPFEGSEAMRENLEGSLCKVTASRASWALVILPGGLSGWVREDGVTPIAPRTDPANP